MVRRTQPGMASRDSRAPPMTIMSERPVERRRDTTWRVASTMPPQRTISRQNGIQKEAETVMME